MHLKLRSLTILPRDSQGTSGSTFGTSWFSCPLQLYLSQVDGNFFVVAHHVALDLEGLSWVLQASLSSHSILLAEGCGVQAQSIKI